MDIWLHHQIQDCHSDSNRRNMEIIDHIWNIGSLFGRQIAVSDSCSCQWQIMPLWSGLGGCGKLTTVCGKFAAVSCRTWQTDVRNLEKFATENCGPNDDDDDDDCEQFDVIYAELKGEFEQLFALNHIGILLRLADACHRLATKQKSFVKVSSSVNDLSF